MGSKEDYGALILDHRNDYRAFLKEALNLKKKSNPHFSYAVFAQKAGFSSKSFLRDVIIGKKRITEKSLSKINKGFSFKGDVKSLFCLMVSEQEKINFKDHSDAKIRSLQKNYSQRIKKSLQGHSDISLDQIFSIPNWQRVYAALVESPGKKQAEVISQLVDLSERQVLNTLNKMHKVGLVSYLQESQTYEASDLSLIMRKLGREEFYRDFYLSSLRRAQRAAKKRISSKEDLFLCATVSIRSEHKAELKQKLRQVIEDFIESSESAAGDQLAEINVSLF